jgi:hypothetical protein
MSTTGINTFALVINYLDEAWTPRHVIVGLFKVHETSGSAMAFATLIFARKIWTNSSYHCFVKDEGNNLGTMVATL